DQKSTKLRRPPRAADRRGSRQAARRQCECPVPGSRVAKCRQRLCEARRQIGFSHARSVDRAKKLRPKAPRRDRAASRRRDRHFGTGLAIWSKRDLGIAGRLEWLWWIRSRTKPRAPPTASAGLPSYASRDLRAKLQLRKECRDEWACSARGIA